MRLRDRRALIAALVLAAAYAAVFAWLIAWSAGRMLGLPSTVALGWPLLLCNLAMAAWRMAMRAGFTAATHGWRMAALTPLHMLIGNIIAMAAAVRALRLYIAIVRHGRVR
jgi:adsorption protein B